MYACEVKAHLIGCWQPFWQPIPFGLNLVVVAVLRDIAALRGRLLYVVTVCKAERFVLTSIKRRLLNKLSVSLCYVDMIDRHHTQQ